MNTWHQPWGLEKESGKREKQERGSGGKFKPKGKKRRWKERRGRCDGEQKRLGSPSCGPWTQPGKQNAWLLHPVLWLSFQPVNAKHLSGPMGSCRPPDKGPLCQPSPSLLLVSLPFHLYPFCTSLVFMLPSPTLPTAPMLFLQPRTKSHFSYQFTLSQL